MSGFVPPNKYDVHRDTKQYKDEGKWSLQRLLPKWSDQQVQGCYGNDYGNDQPNLSHRRHSQYWYLIICRLSSSPQLHLIHSGPEKLQGRTDQKQHVLLLSFYSTQWPSVTTYSVTYQCTAYLPQKISVKEVHFYFKSKRLHMQYMYLVRSLCVWTFPSKVEQSWKDCKVRQPRSKAEVVDEGAEITGVRNQHNHGNYMLKHNAKYKQESKYWKQWMWTVKELQQGFSQEILWLLLCGLCYYYSYIFLLHRR